MSKLTAEQLRAIFAKGVLRRVGDKLFYNPAAGRFTSSGERAALEKLARRAQQRAQQIKTSAAPPEGIRKIKRLPAEEIAIKARQAAAQSLKQLRAERQNVRQSLKHHAKHSIGKPVFELQRQQSIEQRIAEVRRSARALPNPARTPERELRVRIGRLIAERQLSQGVRFGDITLNKLKTGFGLKSKYDPELIEAAKKSGGRWDKSLGQWVFPSGKTAVRVARLLAKSRR